MQGNGLLCHPRAPCPARDGACVFASSIIFVVSEELKAFSGIHGRDFTKIVILLRMGCGGSTTVALCWQRTSHSHRASLP